MLLVTLDTTRADAVGPESSRGATPSFNAIAARGRRFRYAYATVPETLPSHASMLTGLYPAGHGVHENARALADSGVTAAERLKQSGYATAAFVSSFVLSRQFGLAQGFDVYDDLRPVNGIERSARETTDRAIAYLSQSTSAAPLFVWVHYFDPHAPYTPSYDAEIAAMDEQLGRLVRAFDGRAARANMTAAVIVASDHGEGLGERGEATHGNLLYQSTMHVPMVMSGPGVPADVVDDPVSTRRIFHTLLDFAGLGVEHSLRGTSGEVVLGEAMKPYLEYGWQPQIMAVDGSRKAIFAGRTEIFDVVADPRETNNLGAGGNIPAPIRKALDDYPVPVPGKSCSARR